MKKYGIILGVLLFLFPHSVHALDSLDIQKQIDALPASGGTIALPAGEHVLTTPNGSLESFPNGTPIQTAILINKDNVIFQGAGSSTILKLTPHTKMRVISISSNNVTVKNLVIDGNKSNRNGTVPYPDGDVVDGLLYGGHTASNLVFENLEIRNGIEDAMGSWQGTNIIGRNNYNHDNGTPQAGAAGFSLSGVKTGQAYDNRIENNTATGIWSSYDANNIKIFDNIIRNNASGGITLGGGTVFHGLGSNNTGFEIHNNTLSGNGAAGFATITIFASKNGFVKNNIIESSSYDNIQIGGTADIHSSNWQITGNTCAGPVGIHDLGNSENISLQSNACQSNLAQENVLGDCNADGNVDMTDYTMLVTDYGKTGAVGFSPTDIDKNGKVDVFDYNQFVANFGK